MSIQMIPLNQLVISPDNVRRTDRKADLDALCASILAHGLLQNLSVKMREQNRFEVVAGSRRHAALKALAKDGKIARDIPVACKLIDDQDACEASLAENVQRVAMNAMDEADAFQKLLDEGASTDDIGRRFGAPTRHVEQRLAFAKLSPKIKAAYRRGELNLDSARAFCIEPAHDKQDAVLRALGKPITHAGQVRALLTQGAMKSTDRLVRFVGLDAYEAAGGALTRDLFDPDAVFVSDTDLIARLCDARLEQIRADFERDGWGWVDVSAGQTGLSSHTGQRIHPTRRAMTRAERKQLAALDAAIAALDRQLEQSEDDDDSAYHQRDALEAEREALMAQTQQWDKELMALAGVIVRIDYQGAAQFSYGLVAKADQPKLNRLLASRSPEGDPGSSGDGSDAAAHEAEIAPRYSKTLARHLTTERSKAIRTELSQAPDIALSLIVCAALLALRRSNELGIGIYLNSAPITDLERLDQRRSDLLAELPEERMQLLEWSLTLSADRKIEILALLAANAFDTVHEARTSQDRALQTCADRVASALDLDMRKYWTADAGFLAQLSKRTLMEIYEAAPALAAKKPKQREKALQAQAKLKRDDLAKSVAHIIEGDGWLPDLLITPLEAGAFSVTPEGEAAIAAIAAQ